MHKRFILICFLANLIFAQIYSIVETIAANENGLRINAIYYRTDYNVTVLPMSLKYSHINNQDHFSENALLSLPFYYVVNKLDNKESFKAIDLVVLPFLIATIPVIYSNVKAEYYLNDDFGLRFGFNTDYYDSFEFDWQTQSEIIIGFFYDYKKISVGAAWSKLITNRLEHKFPQYLSINFGYRYYD